jgi:hypothetical protein
MFKNCSFYQSFIWAHDVLLLPYGCNLNENQILSKWNNYINGCICLTDWHRNLFIQKYPELKDKIHLIELDMSDESVGPPTTDYDIRFSPNAKVGSRERFQRDAIKDILDKFDDDL